MSEFDYSLNPYGGCSYGCSYCYAAFFVRDDQKREDWGKWVLVKENALEVLRKMKTDLRGKTVYMSSVTDPYQPIERRLLLVRSLLGELLERGVRLVVQTRSPLVVRDIDLLRQFEHARVNMTVGTDSREVHKVFEPHCPSPRRRLRAIQQVREAGVRSCITLTPLLPISNPERFVRDLKATTVEHFVVQPFHINRGKFVAGTRPEALRIAAQMNWTEDRYREFVRLMRDQLPIVEEGREGFAPE
jgi:DNA repair photolyase